MISSIVTLCRPGQLGDTGIIVLQECGPLKKKGCDCEEKEEEEEKIEKTEKTKEVGCFFWSSFVVCITV